MQITLLAIGRLKKGAYSDLSTLYHKRCQDFGRGLGISDVVIHEMSESRASSSCLRCDEEAAHMLQKCPDQGYLIACDERGKSISSQNFSDLLRLRHEEQKPLLFAIGGADGHGQALLDRSHLSLSLGAMTWPHQMARVMLLEQIYRAMTMIKGHPYHRM